MPPIRVLIADDSPTLACRVAELITTIPGVDVVRQVTDGIQAEEQLRTARPDLLILDLEMPGKSGLQLLQEMAPADYSCLIMVFTSCDDIEYRRRCAALGADFFVSKSWPIDRLLEPVRELARARAQKPAIIDQPDPERAT